MQIFKLSIFLVFILNLNAVFGKEDETDVFDLSEIAEIEEFLPLPEALRLIYPKISTELKPEIQIEHTLESISGLDEEENKKRKYFLKKILRRKRQKSGLLRDLTNQDLFHKLRLPETEFDRRQKGAPPKKIVKVVKNNLGFASIQDVPKDVEIVDEASDELIWKEIFGEEGHDKVEIR